MDNTVVQNFTGNDSSDIFLSNNNVFDISAISAISDGGSLHLSDFENNYDLYDNVIFDKTNNKHAKIINIIGGNTYDIISGNTYDVLNLEEPYEIEINANLLGHDLKKLFNVGDRVIVLDNSKNLSENMQYMQHGIIQPPPSHDLFENATIQGLSSFHVLIGTDTKKFVEKQLLLPYDKKLIKNLINYVNPKSTTEKIFEMYKVSIVKMFFSFRFDHKQNGIPTINENTYFRIHKGSNDIFQLLENYYTHFDKRIYEMNKNCKKVLENIKKSFGSHFDRSFSINHMYEIIVGNVDDPDQGSIHQSNLVVVANQSKFVANQSKLSEANDSQESYYLIVLN